MQFSSSDLVYIIPTIFISLTIHEFMHGMVAHWLGDTTAKDMGRLTLNPLKHIDIFTTILLPIVMVLLGFQPILAAKPVPFNPNRVKWGEYGAALVGIAGPFTNLILAILGVIAGRIINPSSAVVINFLTIFIVINVAYFVFNMIPIPPLDGSRLLYAFAPEWLQEIMAQIERLGFFVLLAILVILLPVIGPLLSYLENHVLQLIAGNLFQV
ncbi:MAG TPA: site-2 protease family protein [Candidatus Saccharimonadales bacterium]|nr:site-2 protease family protein [Candidatus Saccharimonadales bacterium]